MTRIKERELPHNIASVQQTETVIGEIARLTVKADKLKAEFTERKRKIDESMKETLQPLYNEIELLTLQTKKFADANKKSLFYRGGKMVKKSIKVLYGSFGYRKVKDTIALVDGISEADAVALAKENGLTHIVETKEFIPDAQLKTLTTAQLHTIGYEEVEGDDEYFVKIDKKKMVSEAE